MTKLFIVMIRSRDNNLQGDKPIIYVFGDLHINMALLLDPLIVTIQRKQYVDIDDDDLIGSHEVLSKICRPSTSMIIQPKLQTNCPIMRFLIINNLKLTSSPTNLKFEHVQYVTRPIAIFQYWWQSSILMQLAPPMWQPEHLAIPSSDVNNWLSCIQDNVRCMHYAR